MLINWNCLRIPKCCLLPMIDGRVNAWNGKFRRYCLDDNVDPSLGFVLVHVGMWYRSRILSIPFRFVGARVNKPHKAPRWTSTSAIKAGLSVSFSSWKNRFLHGLPKRKAKERAFICRFTDRYSFWMVYQLAKGRMGPHSAAFGMLKQPPNLTHRITNIRQHLK